MSRRSDYSQPMGSLPLSKRRVIPAAVRRETIQKPCAVCGVPWLIVCDHVVPVHSGGDGRPSNIQPLCRDCNALKKNRVGRSGSVSALQREITGRGLGHFVRAAYRESCKYLHPFDGPNLWAWVASHPESLEEAKRRHDVFLARIACA